MFGLLYILAKVLELVKLHIFFLVILWEKFQTTSLSSTQTFKTVAKMLCREGVPCCAVLTAGRCVVCRFHTPLADVFRNKLKWCPFQNM